MRKSWMWIGSFLVLYALHATFYLSHIGRLVTPFEPSIAKAGSVATLVVLTLLVVAYIATRDEVMRRAATLAAAVGAITSAFFSYGLAAFDISAPILTGNFWALFILVFLLVYGGLAWRARW